MVRRCGWEKKTATRAKAYSASEVYSNLPSVVEDWFEYEDEKDVEYAELPRAPVMRAEPNVDYLQVLYDSLFPAAIGIDYTKDAEIVERSPLHLPRVRVLIVSTVWCRGCGR